MKVWIRTFGCRANHYDSEVVRAMIERSGHACVDSPDAADVAVFNSCAVTREAEADLRQAVRRAARINPRLRSTVMGCAAALPDLGGPLSLRTLPTVTDIVPGADVAAIGRALGLEPGTEAGATRHQSGARATLRIQDGCDEHCTFCATRIARGSSRSRTIAELIDEAAALAEHHPEIVITGIHIGGYGRDVGTSLGALVEALVDAVPQVRFRLSSIEATEVDEHLAELLASRPGRVAPYLHAPLQSGSNRVLRRMGRHWYTADQYAHAVERLTSRSTVFGLGADVIAGFPGETEDDHAATVAMLDRLPFTSLHVFPYSVRPGTAAERLRHHVPPPIIAQRAADLRTRAAAKSASYRARRAGGRGDVVVVGPSKAGTQLGLTEDYLEVNVRGAPYGRGERFEAILLQEGRDLVAEPLPHTVAA